MLDDELPSNLCMKTVLIGHESAFSLRSLELASGFFLRLFHSFVLKNIPKTFLLMRNKSSVLGASKGTGFGFNDWPSMCEDVSSSVNAISPRPQLLRCEPMEHLTFL